MNYEARTTEPEGMLTLLAIRGIGPQSAERLATRFATLRDIKEASPNALDAFTSASLRDVLYDSASWERAHGYAKRVMDQAVRHSVRIVSYGSPEYPELLSAIPDPPAVLYVKGHLRHDKRYVACIGTREPSEFGIEVTRRIAGFLSEHGWGIVSGLALGVDALSHKAALETAGHTVAVMANGLDSVYPKKNAELAAAILDAGGAWVSEQPFAAPAIPRNLVRRDRLQSGMSAGTVVMQTDVVGGSMHTVRFTLMQRRLLFAPVPEGPHALEPKSRGILALTQQPGQDLANLYQGEPEYSQLLRREYRDRPVAIPIRGRSDYPRILTTLEQVASDVEADVPGSARQGDQLTFSL